MKRIFHHFSLWEEGPAGLWRTNSEIFDYDAAYALMSDTARWSNAMVKVIEQWPYSCEQNLSHTEHNRIAWLGQAAVCIAIGQPAVVTKKTWWQLTEDQQNAANTAAATAIETWEVNQRCLGNQLELMF